MLQNYNKYRILKVFFENPLQEGMGFQLREISRITNIAPTSVKNYLNELEEEGFIKKKKHRIHSYPIYFANRDSDNFRFFKKLDMIISIKESGLLNYLEEYNPNAIALFGSASKGEDILESDIDLFMLCSEYKLNLIKFEKKIKRKINIFFSSDFNRLSKELKNNIINGIILKGYLKVF